MSLNSWSSVAIAFLLLALAAVTMGCTVSQEEAEQAEIDIAGKEIEVRVTATRLADDYEANEVAANQMYDGKVLAVSGTVESVSGGTDGDAYYVDLEVGDFSLVSVRCYFSRSQLDEITAISKGDYVTLRGLGDEAEDRDPFTIDVIGCSIINQ